MGQNDQQSKSRKGSRGATDNAGRLHALVSGNGDKRVVVNWDDVAPDLLAKVVYLTVGLGGAVSFGRSRDGGATSLTLFLDGERQTLWFNGDAVLDDELEKVVAFLGTLQ